MDSPVRWENCHLQVLSYLLMIGTLKSRDFSLSPQSNYSLHMSERLRPVHLFLFCRTSLCPSLWLDIFQVLLREPAVLVDTPSLLPESTPPEASSGTATCKGEHKLGSPPTTKSFCVISWTQQTSLRTEINVLNGCFKKPHKIKHNTRRKQQMLFPYSNSWVLPRSFSNFDSHKARHNHPILQWSSQVQRG